MIAIALDTVVTDAADLERLLTDLAARGIEASTVGEANGYPVLRLAGQLDVINQARLDFWGDGPGGISCDPCLIGECCSWWSE